MSKFKVGDRVRFVGNPRYLPHFIGALATVGADKGCAVCVHFDDPDLEEQQSYSAGWFYERFELYDEGPDPSEEWFK